MTSNPSLVVNPRVEDWIVVRADGRVEVRTGKVDIGQGIDTAVALIVAGELGLAFDRIEMPPVTTGLAPDEGYTAGSSSLEHSGHALRLAAATVRRELLSRASQSLGVDVAELETADGIVRSRATNRSVGFGELVRDAPISLPVDSRAPRRRSVGDSGGVEPIHLRGRVTGTLKFVHDLVAPDMLHARIVRPPHYHAVLAALPDTIDELSCGARIVRDGSFLAVAHPDEHQAIRCAERLASAVRWERVRDLDERPIGRQLLDNRRESFVVRDGVARDEAAGAAPDGPASISAVYERPYQMHGSLAPSAALALFSDGHYRVWTHSQGIYPLRGALAEVLECDPESITVTHVLGAGCYGHNGSDDAALEAALLARAIPDRPLLLKWSREDEHAWEPYGSAMRIELCARLGHDGAVESWSHETFSDTHLMRAWPDPERPQAGKFLAPRYRANPVPAPEPVPSLGDSGGIHRNATPPYAFPETRIVKHLVHGLPLRVSALRTLGAFANVFAAESFMDELAHQTASDPVIYRRRHLDDRRAADVLDAAAKRFGWCSRPPAAQANGTGRGIALAQYRNAKSYCAVAVEVEVADNASVGLRRAVIAADAGEIVHGDGLAAQLEGGFVQAASWTLLEAVTWDRGGITSRDWESYPILRFDNIPEIDTVLLDRPGAPSLGAGEAACGPAGAAIANAVFDATGIRARRLPLTPQALRQAAAEPAG